MKLAEECKVPSVDLKDWSKLKVAFLNSLQV